MNFTVKLFVAKFFAVNSLMIQLALLLNNATQAFAAPFKPFGGEEDVILCDRDPTAYLVGKSTEGVNPVEPCRAQAKIQAIAYECGSENNTHPITKKFLKLNIAKAMEKCDSFCNDLSPLCKGKLQDQISCGFTIPTARALDVGLNIVKCPKHCKKGQAFNYCSLYHANFFATEESLFKKMPYNCFCKRK
jgi:hypothetical protein